MLASLAVQSINDKPLTTSEEAPSFAPVDGKCGSSAFVDLNWIWTAPTCSVPEINTVYDASLEAYVVTIIGSGFTVGDLTSIKLFIDGVEQAIYAIDTEFVARFIITDMKMSDSSDVYVTCDDGISHM